MDRSNTIVIYIFIFIFCLQSYKIQSQRLLVEDARECDGGTCDWEEDSMWDEEEFEEEEENNEVWQSGTVDDMMDYLECDAQEGTTVLNQFYQEDTWNLLQSTYRSVVGKNKSSLGKKVNEKYSSGFQVKFQVEKFDDVGRGVVASEFIPKGTLVWTTKNTARFSSGKDYRTFLKALPSYLACDVLHWAYTRYDTHRRPLVCVDLCEGSFVNSGDDPEEINIGFLPGEHERNSRWSGCDMQFYALRDIQIGEEMRGDYSAFAEMVWDKLTL